MKKITLFFGFFLIPLLVFTQSYNTFFGTYAGDNNTTGTRNSFFGYGAGFDNTTGNNNSFFGGGSGENNTTGSGNSFFGFLSGVYNTTGNNNSFFGIDAGFDNTTGYNNSFFGGSSGENNTTGRNNSFFGYDAGILSTTGSGNSFFGRNAGRGNTTGEYNVYIGYNAGYSCQTGTGNVFIGRHAGYYQTGSNKLYIDNTASSASSYDPLIYGDFSLNRVGINESAPSHSLHVNGTFYSSNDLRVSSDLFVDISESQVGINTITPDHTLDVEGDLRTTSKILIEGGTEATANQGTGYLEIDETLRLDGNEIITNSNTTLFINHDNEGDVRIDDTTLSVDADADRVGINTINPDYDLDVFGTFRSTDDLLVSNDLFVDVSMGRVGVGNTSPAYNLDVTGTFRSTNDLRVSNDLFVDVSASRVGINNTNPTYSLDVIGTVRSTNDLLVDDNLFVDANMNRVGINTISPQEALHVAGRVLIGDQEKLSDVGFYTLGLESSFVPTTSNIRNLGNAAKRWRNLYYSNSLIQSSDRRLKSDIQDLDYGLNEIMQLRPVSYEMKGDVEKSTKLGLIAQEIQPVINEIVHGSEMVTDENTGEQKSVPTEYLGVDYVALIPVLIKGMQEQQELIKEQKAMMQKQQTRIEKLETILFGATPTQNNSEEININNEQLNTKPTGKIFQNNPNPFSTSTIIGYELSDNAKQVNLLITDVQGRQMAKYSLPPQLKDGQLTIYANGWTNGIYMYTLIIDGVTTANGKMVVAK